VATLGRGTIEELLAQPRREKSLASNEVFQETRRRVGEKSDMLWYLNVRRALEMVMGGAPAEASAVVRLLGLSSIEAVGFGAEIRDSGLKQMAFVYTGPEREGILRLLGKGGGAPKVMGYLPENTTYFFSVSLGDFAELWDGVMAAIGSIARETAGEAEWRRMQRGLREVEQRLGFRIREDLLAPFAGEIGVAAKVPETLGFPAVYILIEVKDAQAAEGLLKKVAAVVERTGARLVTTEEQHRGVTVTSFSIVPPGAAKGSVLIPWLRPASAVVGDFLVIGLNATLVKKIVDVHEGGPSLKDDPDFKRVMANLSGGGGMISYANMKELYDYLYSSFAGMAAAQLGPDLTAKLARAGKYFGLAVSCISSDEKGITYEAFSESGGAEQVWMELVIAMFVPRFFEAKEKARSTMCIHNLRQLAIACILYANDHESVLPFRLSELYPDYVADLAVFVCPVSGKEVSRATIDAVSDYRLAIPGANLGDIKEQQNTVMLVEKESRHGSGRNVAYVDGHVKQGVRLERERPRPVGAEEVRPR
jgi:prepilin-type processing-associated H-X9-DG protein